MSQSLFKRFNLWDPSSPYEYTDIDTWLNTIEAVLGAPPGGDGTTWPPNPDTLYSLITRLQNSSYSLGDIKMVVRWSSTVVMPPAGGGPGNFVVPDAKGFVLMDGSTVLAANHDLTDNVGNPLGNITLPDSRNCFPIGANIALTDGTSSNSGTGAANAPGVRGTGGSNAQVHLSANLPDHYHTHDHIHEANVNPNSDYEVGSVPVGGGQGFVNRAQSNPGGDFDAANATHHHHFDLFVSHPRNPGTNNSTPSGDNSQTLASNANSTSGTSATRYGTTKQLVGTGGTPNDPTGGSPGDLIAATANADARPAHFGVFYAVKVKNPA